MKTAMNWTRVLRAMVALLVVMSMLLCGCASAGKDDGDGGKDNGNGNNSSLLKGDGDGKLEAEDVVDNVTGVYGSLLNLVGGDRNALTTGGFSMDMTITLGDDLMEQLSNMLEYQGLDADLSWFKSIGIVMTSIYKETMAQVSMEAKLNGTSILTMEAITDALKGAAYIRVPELNSEYVGGEMDMGMDMEQFLETYNQILDAMEEFGDVAEALPTEAALNTLLKRYVEAAKVALGSPATGEETLSHGGVSVEATTSTYTITTTTTVNIVEALLTTAQSDAELEKVLDGFAAWYNEIMANQISSWEDIDLHEAFMEVVEEGLEAVADAREDMENGDWEEQDVLSFTNYLVNDKQVGFALYAETGYRDTSIYMYNLEDDGDTAFVFNAADSFVIEGTGTVDGDKASGEYTISMYDEDMIYLEIEDFDTKALKKGNLVGTLRVSLSDDMLRNSYNSFLTSDSVIELVLNMTDNKSSLGVNFYNGSAKVFGVNLAVTTGLSGNISVPSDYADASDYEAMEKWANGLSFDKLLRNLRSAGVASELVDMLEDALDQVL